VDTFLYDGDCAFCSSCARFVQRRIPTRARVVAWQFADIEALGVTEAECDAAVQWVPADGPVLAGPAAISALLRDGGPWWRPLGWLLGRRPVLALAWPAYRWVSRNRHRMPGGTATCALPQAERDKLGLGTRDPGAPRYRGLTLPGDPRPGETAPGDLS
jgi:predicted DCC family thiol-disulfide oxidoreductase YuxK